VFTAAIGLIIGGGILFSNKEHLNGEDSCVLEGKNDLLVLITENVRIMREWLKYKK
jgi:hypothetical protein